MENGYNQCCIMGKILLINKVHLNKHLGLPLLTVEKVFVKDVRLSVREEGNSWWWGQKHGCFLLSLI